MKLFNFALDNIKNTLKKTLKTFNRFDINFKIYHKQKKQKHIILYI
jgi:hypothetical protein